jgi:hypothetical protein
MSNVTVSTKELEKERDELKKELNLTKKFLTNDEEMLRVFYFDLENLKEKGHD